MYPFNYYKIRCFRTHIDLDIFLALVRQTRAQDLSAPFSDTCKHLRKNKQTNKLRGLSPLANYNDRATAACQRSYCQPLQIDERRVVSAVDSVRPYFRLSRPEPLFFLSSSSSIVLTRLSGPRSRPTTFQKIW
jgi:hypothetical protein